MPSPIHFVPMILNQVVGSQCLERAEEPTAVTSDFAHVTDYDRVMTSKLALSYAVGMEIIHRARSVVLPGKISRAVDLACGPGHFTLGLANFLDYSRVTGIDLSQPMIEVARQNSDQQSLSSRVLFEVGDITRLENVNSNAFDLSCFADAAHHMPTLVVVKSVLKEMDRITDPTGLVMMMDLVRLRTAELTEKYVNFLGYDYAELGLPHFLKDFRSSMYAAWTADEIRSAIPRDSKRRWVHIVPFGLPTMQVVLGLPEGRQETFIRNGAPWSAGTAPVPREYRWLWRLLRFSLFSGSMSWNR